MKGIVGLSALLIMSTALGLTGCVAESGSSEGAAGEATAALTVGRVIGRGRANRVNVRLGPGSTYGVAYTVAVGSFVNIICQMPTGEGLWDKLDTGYWIHDAYVDTGTTHPVEVPCM